MEMIEIGDSNHSCILEMGILHVKTCGQALHSFYNHRICRKYALIPEKYKYSFQYCQQNIHGIQKPNYETLKQMERRGIHSERSCVKSGELTQIKYRDLSCFKISEIVRRLFVKEFRKVKKLYFKGGVYELKYFGPICRVRGIQLVDLGRFDIGYHVENISNQTVCVYQRHRNLRKKHYGKWRRHCPQYETLGFLDYFMTKR